MQAKPEFIDQLKEGETFTPIEVQSLDQKKYILAFSNKDKPAMLFIFTTTCPYCSQNIPNWKKIYEQKRNDYDITGIGADELNKVKLYAKENDLTYTVFVPLDKEFRKKYKISGVPQTIIIDTTAIIKKFWLGKIENINLDN
jgi:peroxiredoxin